MKFNVRLTSLSSERKIKAYEHIVSNQPDIAEFLRIYGKAFGKSEVVYGEFVVENEKRDV